MGRANWVALVCLLAAAGSGTAAEPYTVKRDIPFATMGGEELKLDMAIPDTGGPHPCVVCFHGGAWKIGSRKQLSQPSLLVDVGFPGKSLLDVFASRGFITVSVSYRLAPANKFPAQIQDAKTAVRFLRANAKKYRIDPDRIAALGISAGAHIAALLGTSDHVPEFEGHLYPEYSSRVNCVVDFFGPADLTLYRETPGIEKSFMVPLLGGTSSEKLDLYKKASPIEHVTRAAVPFLILHGTADIIVPIIHSERLLARLKDVGVPAELVRIPWSGHGWSGETSRRTVDLTVKFLNDHLAKPQP